MNPDVCSVTVGTPTDTATGPLAGLLPETGGLGLVWLAAGLVFLVLGVVLLLRARRRGHSLAAGAVAVLLFGGLLATTPGLTTPASASVTYSDGCTLIAVDDVIRHPGTTNLLPGDTAPVLTATIINRFDGPITITLTPQIADGTLSDDLDFTLTADGTPATGPLTLPAGGSTVVTLSTSLPTSATDSIAGLIESIDLLITATQP